MTTDRHTILAFMVALSCSDSATRAFGGEPHLHYSPSTDIAVFRGVVDTTGDAKALAAVKDFAEKNGFEREQSSLPDSPDYHRGSSPVVMVSNTHDGSLTVALVKDGSDKQTYSNLADDLQRRVLPLGLRPVTRPPLILNDTK